MTTRKNWMAVLAALTLATLLAGAAGASAQDCSCTVVGGCKEVFFYPSGPTILVCPSSGSGDFSGCSKEPPPPGTPLNESLPPVNIKVSGVDPAYGTITTTLDPDATRPSSNATIKSNLDDAQFPATVRISFYARTTISALSGTYCSRTELVFVNDNVNSYRPFKQESLKLESDTEFYECNDPAQKTVFVLKAGTSNVTLN